ncbi:hypothetical protein TanjilG_13360 [Lupinus angustifolius]|uniref:Serine-rich protein-like protein n=1 Tax=Lupinus angustifolius TaxID=3871 RepID=A0A4P1RUY6_LUPAN|nr:PREDICTED: putative protein TPRXL [Lupinus angustifolius]OIW18608.1 hypothetical protein TanjilG_13360 [Lupinus angustifolius]
MALSSRKSRTSTILRSLSPSPRLCNSNSHSSSASAFASSSFTSRSTTTFFNRTPSPTRVSLYGSSSSSSSLRFSLDRSSSPTRSISVSPRTGGSSTVKKQQKRTCMCSPTTHPGSFRCSLHKNCGPHSVAPYAPNRLNARRSAMTNSLVRIRGVEGDLVKRALSALIRPSSHHQKRRGDFHPRPSRLSVMSKAEDENS